MSIASVKSPIIALAPTDWHGTWMNRQHLLSRLASKNWRVVYSTGCSSIWERHTSSWNNRGLLSRITETDGIELVTAGRLTAAWPKLRLSEKFSELVHARTLKKVAGVSWDRKGILFLFHPMFAPFINLLRPKYVVFHVFDVYSEMGEWDAKQQRQLEILCERADLLTAASDAMAQALPSSGSAKARLLYNGVDVDAFIKAGETSCPEDLKQIPSPRLGYVGVLNRKIDFTILLNVAQSRPEWNLVFVGSVNEKEIAKDICAWAKYKMLRALPNTHFVGAKPQRDVPAYMAHMDVNLICYLIKEGHWAAKGYPLKLNEYLAVGKPVVATPSHIINKYFREVVGIAATSEQFLDAIDEALSTGGNSTPERRRFVAQQNTWDRRVEQLDAWLSEIVAD